MKLFLLAVFLLLLALSKSSLALAAETGASPDALHGRNWAFGQSGQRNDAIWKNGISASAIDKKAKAHGKKDAADTSGGINRAIENVEKSKGTLGVSVSNESSAWRSAPEEEKQKADETIFRDKRHVVRAFADVKPSDDLSISVGPELILKDEGKVIETANESQPDSALGIGMQFKLDF